MLPVLLLLLLCNVYQGSAEPQSAPWPLFEFWNPQTWLNPRLTSETMTHILRDGRDSTRRVYQQLKKALLPAHLFFGNIRTQYAAWDARKEEKPQSSRGSGSRAGSKKFNKNSASKHE